LDANKQAINLDSWLSVHSQTILDSTLIRKLENNLFDPARVLMHNQLKLDGASANGNLEFSLPLRKLPPVLPDNWQVQSNDGINCRILATGGMDVLVREYFQCPVNTAGQLPSGFA